MQDFLLHSFHLIARVGVVSDVDELIDRWMMRFLERMIVIIGCGEGDEIGCQLTSTFAAMRKVATAMSCKLFCVTMPIVSAVVDVVHC